MAKQLYKTVRGLTDAVLKTPDGTLLVLPTAAGGVFNPGIEIQEIDASSRLGEMVLVDTYAMARKPTIKLDWKQKNLTLLAMRLGLEFQPTTNANAKVVNNGLLITKNEYSPASNGFEGFGMVGDQELALAAVLAENDLPKKLTRQPFNSFNPAIPNTFAQGVNGGSKWSNNLIGKYVAFEFPQILANAIQLTENSYADFSVTMMTIMQDRSIMQWDFPSVSVKLDEGEINLIQPEMSLTFRVQDDGSTCLSYGITYKGTAQRRRCV
ncbi:hypothetical protein H6G00_01565 [Leptolyngbya sp. FACHB-541]|uniref:hypothetical protein n=1 Tax=Leptolyngbya sp. FACHB-541 TaxID=2692810 RepID=UPI0016828FD8|nr:hypothetical protein [Leptolyngbya sp. FACHB-541]MBD1995318.1 hypothetical protein [Leptolyngbya sp. FACHB-541]